LLSAQRRLEEVQAEIAGLRRKAAGQEESASASAGRLADLQNELKLSESRIKNLEDENSALKEQSAQFDPENIPPQAADWWAEKLKLIEERESYSLKFDSLQAGMRALKIENEVLNRQLLHKVEEISELAAESAELRSRLEYLDLISQERKI